MLIDFCFNRDFCFCVIVRSYSEMKKSPLHFARPVLSTQRNVSAKTICIRNHYPANQVSFNAKADAIRKLLY